MESEDNKAIVDELRSLNARLLGIQEKIEAITKEEKSYNDRQQTPPVLLAELKVPESIVEEWKRGNTEQVRRERFTIGVNVLTLIAVAAYVFINYQIWKEMIGATDAAFDAVHQARRSVAAANKSFAETLTQMQAQTQAQQESAEAAKSSAHAAKSQAETSKRAIRQAEEALHVSERAYISAVNPQIDLNRMVETIVFSNDGRIPSGLAQITIYEATANDTPDTPFKATVVIECHHATLTYDSVPSGGNPTATIQLPLISVEKLSSGHQQVVVSGKVSYADGFSDGPQQTSRFCFETQYHMREKRLIVIQCSDPASVLRQMEQLDCQNRHN